MNAASRPNIQTEPKFMTLLGWGAIFGCVILSASILIADFLVPNHDWIADTISDLGAGKYEFIVDIGIYAFSASLISIGLLAAHIHMGGWGWSSGIVGFVLLGLIVFLVGSRNEYGDSDHDGVVIHIYLVYALALLMAVIPLMMARGAGRIDKRYAWILTGVAIVWMVSAPIFFFLPTNIDGIYERYLGLIAFVLVFKMARLFIRQAHFLR